MKERIKELRKSLGLTQQAFADALGLKQNTVACYETGRSGLSAPTITSICKQWNVSEQWLREGTGDMFLPKSEAEELEELFAEIRKPDDANYIRKLVLAFCKLSNEERREVAELAVKLAKHM